MLGNGEGSRVQYAPQDLWEHKFKYFVMELWSCIHFPRQIVFSCHYLCAQLYLHFPCFLFSSISIRFSLRFSSLAFFCLRCFLFSRSSKGLLRKLKWNVWYNSKFTSLNWKNGSNLQRCPEFLGTGLVAAELTHRCWTRMWAADEPSSDADGESPAAEMQISSTTDFSILWNVSI